MRREVWDVRSMLLFDLGSLNMKISSSGLTLNGDEMLNNSINYSLKGGQGLLKR